jgi:hypothetical protein
LKFYIRVQEADLQRRSYKAKEKLEEVLELPVLELRVVQQVPIQRGGIQ